jgi:superfamily I DNA/RNA helicase
MGLYLPACAPTAAEHLTIDFSPDINNPSKRDDELNLLYVAVTRAMKILAINSLVLQIMQRYKDAHPSSSRS